MTAKKHTHFEFIGRFVAGYDAFNHYASLGLDLRWRAKTAALIRRRLAALARPTVLDLACGTGDMAFAVTRALPTARVAGSDPSADMLRRGAEKNRREASPSQLVRAVARLPFRDATFDAAACAFGARNFVHLQEDLRETARLLRPGGGFYVLDFFVPENGFVRALLKLYNMAVFPLLGFLVTGRIRPYRYLYQSIHRFMTAREFARLALASGYARVSQRRFFFGLVHLIIAERGDDDPAAPRNP